MGVQQILLLALSVILVGAAIAVGIDMFNRKIRLVIVLRQPRKHNCI
jgi:hypothetical protein